MNYRALSHLRYVFKKTKLMLKIVFLVFMCSGTLSLSTPVDADGSDLSQCCFLSCCFCVVAFCSVIFFPPEFYS